MHGSHIDIVTTATYRYDLYASFFKRRLTTAAAAAGGAQASGGPATAGSTATIEPPSAGDNVATLRVVREELEKRGLDAFIVPSGDPHLSEYPPFHFWRRVSGSRVYT
jgi:hypothetical protein